MTMPAANRGEVWLVDLGYVAKVRPCLVLNIAVEDRDRALVTIVPHTTSPRDSRFEVDVGTSFLRAGVFDAQNLVTIPRAKLIRRLGTLGVDEFALVESKVRFWLGLKS
jgi:mRNA interferase MazF